jgi:hypothetical protein
MPSFWHGPRDPLRSLVADARTCCFVALLNFYPQILVKEEMEVGAEEEE